MKCKLKKQNTYKYLGNVLFTRDEILKDLDSRARGVSLILTKSPRQIAQVLPKWVGVGFFLHRLMHRFYLFYHMGPKCENIRLLQHRERPFACF